MRRSTIAILTMVLLLGGCGGGVDGADTTAPIGTVATDTQDTVATDTTAVNATTGASQSNDSMPVVDACSLLTSDEVAEVLGEGGESSAGDTPPFYSCQWENGTGLILLGVVSFADADTARASFDVYSATGDVDGVGDRAVYNDITEVAALSGSFVVSFDVATFADEETARSQAKDLALLVIPRLP